MPRLLFALATALSCSLPFADQARASTNAISHVDHTILKEPIYQSTPKYCLITIGDHADAKIWMVEDGRRLYVDKNANGDLTDDGPPAEPDKVRYLDANDPNNPRHPDTRRWDFKYVVDGITLANGTRHAHLDLSRWNYHDPEDEYGLSVSADGQLPMYAGWFGTFWSTKRAQAPVIHIGGPYTPRLLRRDVFTIGEKGERLSVCFVNPGSGKGAVSRLSIEALRGLLVPVLHIEWPTAAGAAPLRTSHELTERCCYWEFYTTTFEVPKGVVPGKAKVTVDLNGAATFLDLTTTEIVMPVVAPLHGSDSARR